VLERRVPSLLVEQCVLITGEVDRTTEFEQGMPPPNQVLVDGTWQHDPLVLDDQALVVHVRDRGLVRSPAAATLARSTSSGTPSALPTCRVSTH
jgi:hypothetical protein